jgi:hypothetical protein
MAPAPRSVTAIAEMNTRANRQARDDWELFTGHRVRLTEVIGQLGAGDGSGVGADGVLALLGAGNCNDVDLVALAERFREIHLVDIDPAGLDRARQRQPPEVRRKLVAHGGIDLTGVLGRLDRWKARPPDARALAEAVTEGAAAIAAALPAGRVDVAVSCCLMSQLGWCVEMMLGEEHPAQVDIRIATIAVHLHTLAALCRPGGAALLASDVISSQHYPPLEDLPPDTDLRALAETLVPQRELVYLSASPVLVARSLRQDPVLRGAFAPPVVLTPWLWNGRMSRTYLVYPQLLRRLPAQDEGSEGRTHR